MLKPTNYVVPIEVILELNASVLQKLVDQVKKCDNIHVVIEPGIVPVESNNYKSNIVIGTGSIVLPSANCLSSASHIEMVEPVKNEWINTCTITPYQFLGVKMDEQNDVIQVKDIMLVSLTTKMIYPRVFNGLKTRNLVAASSKNINGNVEWIMSDSELRYPAVYFGLDNAIHVSPGSEEMYKLMALLSLEARCSQYRLIVSQ